jgi:hypothetical protein
VAQHLEEGERGDVDRLGVVDQACVVLDRRVSADAAEDCRGKGGWEDGKHTVPGAAPPKFMPPPSRLLKRSMIAGATDATTRTGELVEEEEKEDGGVGRVLCCLLSDHRLQGR